MPLVGAALRQRPRADGIDDAHWDALEEGRIVVQRCETCDRRRWFPSPRCPHCGSVELTWVGVRNGSLHTWTTTYRQLHPAFPELPFTICVVDLEGDDAVRFVVRLYGSDHEADLRIGEPIRLEVVVDENGYREAIAMRGHSPEETIV
jgi:uncharacterized OB-fold protein